MSTIDKPKDVLRIYDNGGKTADRYTVVMTRRTWSANPGMYQCLGMSNAPEHPQGISQFSECMLGRHLGKRIDWDELPEHIQKHVRWRVT